MCNVNGGKQYLDPLTLSIHPRGTMALTLVGRVGYKKLAETAWGQGGGGGGHSSTRWIPNTRPPHGAEAGMSKFSGSQLL